MAAIGSETVRRGEALRVYRRPQEKYAVFIGGVLIFGIATVRLVESLVRNEVGVGKAVLPVSLLLALYLILVAGFFFMASRVGVVTSRLGVRSTAFTRKAFIEWKDIQTFVVAHYTPMSVCVLAERRDGTRVALNGLATWARRQHVLEPYRDALITELNARREVVS